MTSIFTENDQPNVFTIEPNVRFLGELARGLNVELGVDDFGLSDAIIFLPTRRAARELANEFMKVRDEKSTILPRIRTLGDIEPDDLNLQELDTALSPTISPMARKFLLAKFIAARNTASGWSNDSVAALGAADALAELLESAELSIGPENPIDWDKLHELVEEKELAGHWELSTKFLEIVTHAYPEYLTSLGLLDPAHRRRLAIEKLATNWQQNPPAHPVIIAGSTGAVQSTRGLMRVVARLPKGVIILPGLDKNMGNEWKNIARDHSHPQRSMHDTIGYIGISRDEVKPWAISQTPPEFLKARRIILNTALTPQEATADWRKTIDKLGADTIKNGLEGLSIIEAETEDEEASAIALEMRQSLEQQGQTCALVTPSSDIARRVSSKMQKWGIGLDVSSGIGVGETRLGIYVKLIGEFILDYGNPVVLAALLAHPYCHFGLSAWDKKVCATSLELGLLRGPRKYQTIGELINIAKESDDKSWKDARAKRDEAVMLLENISNIALEIEAAKTSNDLAEVAKSLLFACEKIAQNSDSDGGFIYKGEAGTALGAFFAELLENGVDYTPKDLPDGINIINSLLKNVVVRPRGTNPYLAIIGPLEARLLSFDKIILAGLDEGVWPKPPDTDPFLSRPMREKLGLQSRDLRLGLSAHDFAQLASGARVIITRAARRSGSPSVPSRFLWRLKTLTHGALGREIGEAVLKSGTDTLAIARALLPQRQQNLNIAPRPKPPVSARPNRFSATQIETWIRDPYKLYVTKILGLRDLEPIGGEVSARERGSAIHAALEILPLWANKIPKDPKQTLLDEFAKQLKLAGFEGEELVDELIRLEPTAELIAANEVARIEQGITQYAERWADYSFETNAGTLEVFAKIDRIDVHSDGDFEIWDYKTGTPPTDKQISSLISPQLPVTAFILEKSGGFKDGESFCELGKLKAFGHIHIGNSNPEFKEYSGYQGKGKPVVEIPDLLEHTETTLNKLFEKYSNPEMPYISKPRPQFSPKVNYEDMTDRLARRAEWANATDTEGGSNE
jgi:ATP-dependent helicase/nuclease subunit B